MGARTNGLGESGVGNDLEELPSAGFGKSLQPGIHSSNLNDYLRKV